MSIPVGHLVVGSHLARVLDGHSALRLRDPDGNSRRGGERRPSRIRSSRLDVPEGLQTVVSRCLAKEPSRRYADVVELALALKDFAPATGEASFNRISAILRSGKGRGTSVPKPVLWPSDSPTLESGNAPATTPDAERPKHTAAGWGSSQAGARQSRTRLVATITAAAAMCAFAAALGYTIRDHSPVGGDAAAPGGPSIAMSVAPSAAPSVPPSRRWSNRPRPRK